MDLAALKKRLSTFRSEKGSITRVTDDVLVEVLIAWETWTGLAKDFYKEIGVSQTQMAGIIGKAKKLKREGRFPFEEFKEIKIQDSPSNIGSLHAGPCLGVEMMWDNGKLIRFQQVEQLVDFLKKVS